MWYLYICNKKGNLYTGITTDLGNRMRQHGHAELLFIEEYKDKKEAAKRECEVKGWRREKKEALVYSKDKPVSLS